MILNIGLKIAITSFIVYVVCSYATDKNDNWGEEWWQVVIAMLGVVGAVGTIVGLMIWVWL